MSESDEPLYKKADEGFIDVLDRWVTERPLYVVVVFLVVTVLMVGGLGQITTETGTQEFEEDVPEFDAFERVQEEFEPAFEDSGDSTQLIQRGENVLSKKGILRMLRAQERILDSPEMRVESGSSVARMVATNIDPGATTVEEQVRAVENAPENEVRRAVRDTLEQPGVAVLLSNDLNERDPSASATIGTVSHKIPEGDDDTLLRSQRRAQDVSETVGGDIVVFGSGILDEEFEQVIGDSLTIVMPVVVLFLILFLIIAYRDPVDLLLAMLALVMTVVWTFGFMGYAGIAFNQMMIAVPPLLLAIGIDFGIHAVNRYREERVAGFGIVEGMDRATDQLLIAFFIVAGTTMIGFGANVSSALSPVRSFGLVATIGIFFTFLIFGIFMPSAKVYLDELREGTRFPEFANEPLGEGSSLGDVLNVGTVVSDKAPVIFLVLVLLLTVGAGVSATNVETTFEEEDFLPPDETPVYVEYVPVGDAARRVHG